MSESQIKLKPLTDMSTIGPAKKRVVIVGGGFAGLSLCQQLFNNLFYEITLIDKNNYNYFTPLLYQVATGFLEPSSISYPFRKIFRGKNLNFRMGTLLKVNTDVNTLSLTDGSEIGYDILVFAAGSRTNFLGSESTQRHAFSLKGIDDALHMRNELIKTLEMASLESNPLIKKKLLTVVIAGGGPTGVEIAGMLAEMNEYILGKDYPGINKELAQIYLIDASPYLLAPMSEKTHQAAYKTLTQMGVHVKLNTRVILFENDKVYLSTGEVIEAKTLLWAAGVIANSFEGIADSSIGRGNRMITDQYNRVLGYNNLYAIGDISVQFTDIHYPAGHPQLAQPAIQQGKALAKNLLLYAKGKPMKPFSYFDKGEMAIIGRRHAYADLFKHKFHIGGLLGLTSWLFIHLISLVNYNNIIKTLYNWIVAYLTRDQALRMIFRSENRETRVYNAVKPVEV
ncbi:NAD(P)/FAD-dependent oxidoreductase [Spirosoma jeollabukense]